MFASGMGGAWAGVAEKFLTMTIRNRNPCEAMNELRQLAPKRPNFLSLEAKGVDGDEIFLKFGVPKCIT
jgi:hypothetical protein